MASEKLFDDTSDKGGAAHTVVDAVDDKNSSHNSEVDQIANAATCYTEEEFKKVRRRADW
jgi:hypothetical protein